MNLEQTKDAQFLEVAQAMTECNGVGFTATFYTPFGVMIEIRSEAVMTCLVGELATHLKCYAEMLHQQGEQNQNISKLIHAYFPMLNLGEAKEKIIQMVSDQEFMTDIFSLTTSESTEEKNV